MNDKPFRIARLIRLAIFLGILFSFAWMFRWEIGTPVQGQASNAGYVKLDRWTGTSYHCVFWVIPMAEEFRTQEYLIPTSDLGTTTLISEIPLGTERVISEIPLGTSTLISETPVEVPETEEAFCTPFGEQQ